MHADAILAELEELPPAVLLVGPLNDDMKKLVRRLRERQSTVGADFITLVRPVVSQIRSMVEAVQKAPFGPILFVTVLLDGVSEEAQQALLKTVEEPPPDVRFVFLVSDTSTILPALAGRCWAARLTAGFLPEAVTDDNAMAAAEAAVRAALTRDPAVLADALRPWGDKCPCKDGRPHDKGEHYVDALQKWAVACAMSLRPELFRPEATPPGVPAPHRCARIVVRVLSQHPRARPQNAAAAALSLAFLED